MAKRTDIKKVLIIGSGPIVIGQAAEFDYAGTQACLALKEEGYEVILCNSNPATIMTDTSIADKVYMEPLTLDYVAKILRHERPDAIVPGIGGQTGLNLAMGSSQSAARNFWALKADLSSRLRTASCSKNCALVWASPYSRRRSPVPWKKVFRQRVTSDIRSYCGLPSHSAARAGALRTVKKNLSPS